MLNLLVLLSNLPFLHAPFFADLDNRGGTQYNVKPIIISAADEQKETSQDEEKQQQQGHSSAGKYSAQPFFADFRVGDRVRVNVSEWSDLSLYDEDLKIGTITKLEPPHDSTLPKGKSKTTKRKPKTKTKQKRGEVENGKDEAFGEIQINFDGNVKRTFFRENLGRDLNMTNPIETEKIFEMVIRDKDRRCRCCKFEFVLPILLTVPVMFTQLYFIIGVGFDQFNQKNLGAVSFDWTGAFLSSYALPLACPIAIICSVLSLVIGLCMHRVDEIQEKDADILDYGELRMKRRKGRFTCIDFLAYLLFLCYHSNIPLLPSQIADTGRSQFIPLHEYMTLYGAYTDSDTLCSAHSCRDASLFLSNQLTRHNKMKLSSVRTISGLAAYIKEPLLDAIRSNTGNASICNMFFNFI